MVMIFSNLSGYGPFRDHVMASNWVSVSVEANLSRFIAATEHISPELKGGECDRKRKVDNL